ncbi:hypothetical protein AXX17_AT5G14550 [Arabidopsis thaliana]|jgi:hypothetical protein|uniref:diphosphoinositol-pentakisphosphate 1-kinase n=1 Tax=Arabidopsis thaliana TaxID=3702 RepID=A0A178UP83_ARATH|nr:hypothetical protein AXX17_AT5G14550 [Arabidopsis thaliana]
MGVEEGAGVDKKITIGVCVMEKKVFSAPMGQIMDRIHAFGEFEIIHFGDKVILEDPVESWPICDCLIAFYSSGYPLEKVQAYSSLRKPFLVNELDPQYLLHDRRKVYEVTILHCMKVGLCISNHHVIFFFHVSHSFIFFTLPSFMNKKSYILSPKLVKFSIDGHL